MLNESNQGYAYAYKLRDLSPRYAHPFQTYDHIWQQPAIITKTIDQLAKPICELVQKRAHLVKRFYLLGVGSSNHVALQGAFQMGHIAGMEAEGFDSFEWSNQALVRPLEYAGVIAYTASGSTPEVISTLAKMDRKKCWTLGITNQDQSELAELCQDTLVAPGGTKYVVDYFSRLACTYLIATEFAEINGRSRIPWLEALSSLAELVYQTLQDIETQCERIGQSLEKKRAVYVVGTGLHAPTALETAMRFDEMTTVPTKGLSISQYLHGSIGVTSSDLGLILFAPSGRGFDRMLDAAKIAHKVGATTIAITNEGNHALDGEVDEIVRIPEVSSMLQPFLYALPGQLIPYFLEANLQGGNPDIRRTDQAAYATAFEIAFRKWE